MASNRTMQYALGKLGDPSEDDEKPTRDDDGGDGADDDSADEPDEDDDKKQAFLDMCKAIRAGKDDKAYELYQDLCEGM